MNSNPIKSPYLRSAGTRGLFVFACLLLGTAAAIGQERSSEKASEARVTLKTQLGTPLVAPNQPGKVYYKVGLTGAPLPPSHRRAPVNVSVVLDRSSSMSGDRIEKAREAACMLIDQLGPEDILSIVAYDSVVEVVVAAVPVTQHAELKAIVRGLEPRGTTALFAGVSRGIQEVEKFLDPKRVNRVILLSDGQANVGPRSPNELGRLGAAAAKRGIAISTVGLGLGYNEDLMMQLAAKSDGNHAFAESGDELARIFRAELGDLTTVVAQEVSLRIQVDPRVTAIRVLNRDAEVRGHEVILSLNQLYAGQEKLVMLELDVPGLTAGSSLELARVEASWADVFLQVTERASSRTELVASRDLGEVERKTDAEVMVAAVEILANEKNRQAVALRDEGRLQEAQQVLQSNTGYLLENAKKYKSPKLKSSGEMNEADAEALDDANWNKQRKTMRKRQHELDYQQSY